MGPSCGRSMHRVLRGFAGTLSSAEGKEGLQRTQNGRLRRLSKEGWQPRGHGQGRLEGRYFWFFGQTCMFLKAGNKVSIEKEIFKVLEREKIIILKRRQEKGFWAHRKNLAHSQNEKVDKALGHRAQRPLWGFSSLNSQHEKRGRESGEKKDA